MIGFEDDPEPERIPQEMEQRSPPGRRPPTAVGTATPGPEWDPLRNALPDYVMEGVLTTDDTHTVIVAWDRTQRTPATITVLRSSTASLRQEAATVALIDHPGLVRIREIGEREAFAYVVTDHYEGKSLLARLKRGPLTPRALESLADDVLGALEALHRHGVVHGALAPGSIALVAGRAVLTDLPWNRQPSAPAYQAPEQASGGPATVRTDLYAVGALLYELHTADTWSATNPDPSALKRLRPRAVGRALRRALASDAEQRWGDATSFRRALHRRWWWPF